MSDKTLRQTLIEAWERLMSKEEKKGKKGNDLSAAGAAKKIRDQEYLDNL